jgi:hypothetical protein
MAMESFRGGMAGASSSIGNHGEVRETSEEGAASTANDVLGAATRT